MTEADTKPVSTDTLDKLAATVAQQKAMERGPTFLPHGCRLFRVETGWEGNMIQRDKGVVTCDTLLSLEAAIRDEDVKVVFIPLDAIFSDADIEKVCQRNGVTKTLFKEVKSP
ncbi:MAG: hypothetical protein PW788_15050 [Micavibrio sp.]|nr:hypothetical protein [Micavibrio sp.]